MTQEEDKKLVRYITKGVAYDGETQDDIDTDAHEVAVMAKNFKEADVPYKGNLNKQIHLTPYQESVAKQAYKALEIEQEEEKT